MRPGLHQDLVADIGVGGKCENVCVYLRGKAAVVTLEQSVRSKRLQVMLFEEMNQQGGVA